MNIKNYVFEGRWFLIDEARPTNAKRVLLTNGDTIVIGSLTVSDDMIHWLFDRGNMDGYNPVAWMELPSVAIIKKYEATLEKSIVES